MNDYFKISAKGNKGHISIIGEISWWKNSSEDFKAKLEDLTKSGITELEGYLNSAGGQVFEANEIYNLIKSFPGKKTVKIGALCASAATVIALAYDEIEIASNSTFMIHNPMVTVAGDERVLESKMELLKSLKTNFIKLYSNKTGLPESKISEMMDKETWMNADQALKLGFANRIIGADTNKPAVENSTLKNFKNTPVFFSTPLYNNQPEMINGKPVVYMSKTEHEKFVVQDQIAKEQGKDLEFVGVLKEESTNEKPLSFSEIVHQ